MSTAISRLLVTLGLLLTVSGQAAAATYSFDTPISGDQVQVTVTLTDAPSGDAVDVTVSIPPGEGDLLGLFGNVVDESLVPGMGVDDPTGIVTQWQFQANQVWKVGGGNTMTPIKKWDWGLRIAENGSAGGAVESASFTLTAPGLSVDQLAGAVNQGWVLGVRIQSTLGPEGSSKMGLSGDAPRIRITDPEDGALLAATPAEVLGTVLGTGVAVDVNGISAQVSAGTFSADVPLSESPNTLTATGVNASGTATDAIDVVLDTIPPLVTITAPADGTTTAETSVLVTGTVTDASPIQSVTLNGQGVVLVDGAFSAMVDLPTLGTHTITATALDAAGHEGSGSIQVTRGEAPALQIQMPLDGSLLPASPVDATGSVSGFPEPTVLVAGVPATVSGGTFTATVPLVEGAQTIAASATNALGSASDEVLVTLDTLPPVVVITAPADGTLTTEPSVIVSGSVSDASPIASFTVAGETVGLAGDGSFTTTVSLDLGERLIAAEAVDPAGHSGSASVTVTRGEAPSVAIGAPSDGAYLGSGAVEVTGTVSGTAPVEVTVDGVAATVTGGSFSASLSLAEGAATLTAVAANDFGSAGDSVDVTVDTTPPAVTITVPPDGTEFTEEPIGLIGEVTDASPILALTLNGSPITPGSAFAETVGLVEGPNTITVEATDAAGNVGDDSVTVTLSAGGPPLTISIATPPNGALVSQATISVAGAVSDETASVAVNGTTATVTGTQYVAAAVPLTEGQNQVTATATRGSDTASAAVTVTYNAPPQVIITSPADGAVLRSAATDVEGSVDDPTAYVDVNGVVASVGSAGRFVARDVPLAVGDNVLTARAIDPLGAQGRDSVSVTRDDAAAGQVRLVVIDDNNRWVGSAGRASFSNLEEYLLNLSRGEYSIWWRPPIDEITLERFSPPIDVPTVFPQLEMYVLAEDPGEASIAAFIEGETVPFAGPESKPLLPIDELDYYLYLPGLAVPEAFDPEEFEPQYFASFWDLFSGCMPDFGCGPNDLSAAARIVLRGEAVSVQDQVAVYADFTHPQVRIQSPEAGSVIAGNAVTVSGVVYDEGPLLDVVWYQVRDEYDVVLDEGSVPLLVDEIEPEDPWDPSIRGRFAIPDIILGTGFYTIEVRAWDTLGQPDSESTYVYSDPNAPPVALVSPQDGQALLTANASVDLNFAETTTLVSVNWEPDGRTFDPGLALGALELPLSLGANSFTLELDAGSGSFTLSFTLFRVDELAGVRIVSPAPDSFLNTETITVEGTVPLGTPLVAVNGIFATIAPDGVGFTAEIPIQAGENEIRAVAYPFGQSASLQVTGDFVAPSFLAYVPEDGTATLDEDVVFAGFVDEPAEVILEGPAGSVSGRTIPDASQSGWPSEAWRHVFDLDPLDLALGSNALTLRAVDAAGNETVEALTLLRTETALLLVSPAEGTPVPALRTDVTLDALEDVTISTWYAAGRRLPALEGASLTTGVVTVPDIPLLPGANEMRVVYQRMGGLPEILSFDVESTATGAATVTGTVSDASTGDPLGGAFVTVSVGGVQLVAPTAPDGTFAIEVEPGDVSVFIEREGFLTATVAGPVGAGQVLAADAALLPWATGGGGAPGSPSGGSTSSVAGIVTDASNGAPLEGVLVHVASAVETVSVITGADGSFHVSEIPVSLFDVTFTRVGYFPQAFQVNSGEPVFVPLDPELEPLSEDVTLVGQVTSGLTGGPEGDVTVAILGTDLTATTDSDGTFVVPNLPLGTQSLRLRKVGFRDRFFTLPDVSPVPGGHPIEVFFTFPTEEGIADTFAIHTEATGRVIDPFTLAPIPDATIVAHLLDGATSPVSTATSDSNGEFTLLGLPNLETVEIEATAPGRIPERTTAFVVFNGEDQIEFQLVGLETGTLTGTVTNAATGEAVRNAHVSVADGFLLEGATDGDGAYDLSSLPPGEHRIVVSHPGYLPLTVDVSVAPGETIVVDAAITGRPRSGSLAGTVLDADTGSPIADALVSVVGGAQTATTDSQGGFELSPVPSGLVALEISASGFAIATRTVAVDADSEPGVPTTTHVTLMIDTSGGPASTVSGIVTAAEGGALESADRRLRVNFSPGSLSGDARVSLSTPEVPVAVNGEALSLDPSLGLSHIAALGEEIEIRVEAIDPDDPTPVVIGAVVLEFRYSAEEEAAAGLEEDTLAPVYFDGTGWTVPQVIPYLHAVDWVNRRVITGAVLSQTVTGESILPSEQQMLLAQAAGSGGAPADVFRSYVVRLAGKITAYFTASPLVDWVDIANDPATPPDFRDQINERALPFLIVSGWDWRSALWNVTPDTKPFNDPRYQVLIRSLFSPIHGVYRPIFVSNNTRASIEATGREVSEKLDDVLREFKGKLFEEPDETGLPAYSYSQGVLVARAYSAEVRNLGSSQSVGPISVLVSMGGMHHGAIQGVVEILTGSPTGDGSTLLDVLKLWSPGTADLLDYEDVGGSGNRFLYRLNRNYHSTGNGTHVMIAGTDRRFPLPLEILEELGIIDPADVEELEKKLGDTIVGSDNGIHDAAIPEYSALGRRKLSDAPPEQRVKSSSIRLPGMRSGVRSSRFFNHHQAGMASQPITSFVRNDITDHLPDWGTVIVEQTSAVLCPDESTKGTLYPSPVRFEWNTPNDGLSGAAVVAYILDGTDEWRILEGADSTGKLPSPEPGGGGTVKALEGRNSKQVPELRIEMEEVELPEVDLNDPSTVIKDIRVVGVMMGDASLVKDSVEPDLSEALGFEPRDPSELPICTCPDPAHPLCQ